MEILLKMKQAENPQFNFLSYDNDLHPYYRHMLAAIKNQRYAQSSSVPPKGKLPFLKTLRTARKTNSFC